MKILVTGALGHIGSRLIREIPEWCPDAEILLLDNLSTQRYCSLFELPNKGNYRFLEADILKDDLTSILRGVDSVVHLAAITNAAASFEIAEQVEQVNYVGTERVAQACIEANSRLIFLSTTSVYGTQEEVVDENCAPSDLQPQSPYAASKLKAERMLQDLGQSQGLRFVICRFGTIFGISPGMRFHTAINKFCWQALNGQAITVWRTAMQQKRPYLDLKDGVSALGFILRTNRFDNEIYNVLTLNATVNEIVESIRLRVPDLRIEYVDSKIMNQLSYTVDCSKFAKLGFRFQGELQRGVGETLELLRGVRMGCLAN